MTPVPGGHQQLQSAIVRCPHIPADWAHEAAKWTSEHPEPGNYLAIKLALHPETPQEARNLLKAHPDAQVAALAGQTRIHAQTRTPQERGPQAPLPEPEDLTASHKALAVGMEGGYDSLTWADLESKTLLAILWWEHTDDWNRARVARVLAARDQVPWHKIHKLPWRVQTDLAAADPERYEQAGCWNTLTPEQEKLLLNTLLKAAQTPAGAILGGGLRYQEPTWVLAAQVRALELHAPETLVQIPVRTLTALIPYDTSGILQNIVATAYAQWGAAEWEGASRIVDANPERPWEQLAGAIGILAGAGADALATYLAHAEAWQSTLPELAELAHTAVTLGVDASR